MAQTPLALFDTDSLLDEEERAIRDTVRQFVESKIRPELADWYEAGRIPADMLHDRNGHPGLGSRSPCLMLLSCCSMTTRTS